MLLKCINCSYTYDIDKIIYLCEKCNDLLEVVYDLDKIGNKLDSTWKNIPLSVWKYQPLLPIDTNIDRVTRL